MKAQSQSNEQKEPTTAPNESKSATTSSSPAPNSNPEAPSIHATPQTAKKKSAARPIGISIAIIFLVFFSYYAYSMITYSKTCPSSDYPSSGETCGAAILGGIVLLLPLIIISSVVLGTILGFIIHLINSKQEKPADPNNPMHVRKPIIIALVIVLSPIVAFLAINIIWKLIIVAFFKQPLF